ncbi:MAG: hypothetical protein A2231_08160 [Candidatus Firestonebacteria bacterium RIFOXYA2_FULL_40_8]|nr:MAG: hypothetical protein A2231_08160 [Candidatus Firestonebacteria bacterium RIFOXYA2_FULL_40_8]
MKKKAYNMDKILAGAKKEAGEAIKEPAGMKNRILTTVWGSGRKQLAFKSALAGAIIGINLILIAGLFYLPKAAHLTSGDDSATMLAANIMSSLIKDGENSTRLSEASFLVANDNLMGEKEFIREFRKKLPKNVESFAIFVSSDPREIADKERMYLGLSIEYVSLKAEKLAGYNPRSKAECLYVSVLIKGDGVVNMVLKKKKDNYRLLCMSREGVV